MAKELLVNVSRGEEVRVALVEDGRLEEIYLERDSAASNVGNIYLGKVTNVEGSIQAAFVDFGYGRNGFLHVQDLHPDYFPEGGRWDKMQERVGKKIGRRDRPPIQDCLRRGDHIVVQIIKEGIGTKGPTLTSYPSIPGRFLVMMPGVAQMGVSKNIEDETERRRLRKVLDGLKPPKDVGFIIRTAGMGKTKAELERDFKYLTRLYEQIEHHRKNARPPTLLYSEGDLVTRTVRDVWSSDVDRVICDEPETALRIKQFFRLLMPRTKVNVQLYQGHVPLFHAAGIEAEIETMFSRHVPLPSGGSLVIDSTEAVVAIDVNSGKFREHDDAEETAFRTDMEAAEEICRQLRLRDLGGVVIVDFIDLRYSRHRESLFNKLTDLFKQDKAKSRHLPMNEFGIVSITRQRMRPDLKKSVFMPCPWSGGTGYIKTPESMALDVMRRLRVAAADDRVRAISVRLFPSAALHVLNSKRQALADLERASGKAITIRQDESLAADDVAIELLDDRDGIVQIEALQPVAAEQPDSGGRRRRRRRRRGGEGDGAKSQGSEKAAREEEGGLIHLADLVELGELKLDEVEKLVDELAAGEQAAREAMTQDPQKIILDALRSGALLDDDEGESQPSDGEPAPQAKEEEQGGRRRRRRRRGRRDDESPAVAAQQAEAEDAEAVSEESEDAEAVEEAESQPAATGEPGQQGEGAREGGRRRRRRRRGRRDNADDTAASNGQVRAEREPAPAPAARREGSSANGSRAEQGRRPAEAGSEQRQEGGRRRRRGRKGRGMRGHTVFGHVGGVEGELNPLDRIRNSGLSDEQLDAHINGNLIPQTPAPAGVYREEEDDEPGPAATTGNVEPAPEQPTGESGGRRRRRRRRRGGGGAGADRAPETAVVSAEPADDELESGEDEASVEPEASPEPEALEPEASDAIDEVLEAEPEPEPEAEVEAEPEPEVADAAPAKPARRSRSKKTAKKTTRKTSAAKTAKSAAPRKRASTTKRSKSAKKSDA